MKIPLAAPYSKPTHPSAATLATLMRLRNPYVHKVRHPGDPQALGPRVLVVPAIAGELHDLPAAELWPVLALSVRWVIGAPVGSDAAVSCGLEQEGACG